MNQSHNALHPCFSDHCVLTGAYVDGLEFQQMEEIWLTAACYLWHTVFSRV